MGSLQSRTTRTCLQVSLSLPGVCWSFLNSRPGARRAGHGCFWAVAGPYLNLTFPAALVLFWEGRSSLLQVSLTMLWQD